MDKYRQACRKIDSAYDNEVDKVDSIFSKIQMISVTLGVIGTEYILRGNVIEFVKNKSLKTCDNCTIEAEMTGLYEMK